MKVSLIAHTPQPEMVVAAAAKLCYSSTKIDDLLNGLTAEKSREFVEMLAALGHESPTEHANFTFAIEGVSRALLAQITRHRHASFSVQSQRYVQLDNFEYVTPPELLQSEEASTVFANAMGQEAALYRQLTNALEEKHAKRLVESGMDAEKAAKIAKKQAIEDARFVLPNACTTKMIVTMNARSLNNFFRQRCCNRAQWEIQHLADKMLLLAKNAAPSLFAKAGPQCVFGHCSEGKMTCGKAMEVAKKYKNIIDGG